MAGTYGVGTYGAGTYGDATPVVDPQVGCGLYGAKTYGAGTYGDACALVHVAPPPTVIGGGGAHYSDDDIRALVEAKYEALQRTTDELRLRRVKVEAEVRQAQQAPVVSPPAPGFAPGATVARLGTMASVVAPRDDSSGAPLLPTAAERARLARQRDDDEALVLMLLGEV